MNIEPQLNTAMNLKIKEIHQSILETNSNDHPLYLINEHSSYTTTPDECEETKKLSIMISKNFHKELRIFCAREEITITELVTNAVRAYIANK